MTRIIVDLFFAAACGISTLVAFDSTAVTVRSLAISFLASCVAAIMSDQIFREAKLTKHSSDIADRIDRRLAAAFVECNRGTESGGFAELMKNVATMQLPVRWAATSMIALKLKDCFEPYKFDVVGGEGVYKRLLYLALNETGSAAQWVCGFAPHYFFENGHEAHLKHFGESRVPLKLRLVILNNRWITETAERYRNGNQTFFNEFAQLNGRATVLYASQDKVLSEFAHLNLRNYVFKHPQYGDMLDFAVHDDELGLVYPRNEGCSTVLIGKAPMRDVCGLFAAARNETESGFTVFHESLEELINSLNPS